MSGSSLRFEPGSFRDRHGRVLVAGDRIYRVLGAQASADWQRLANSRLFEKNVASGRLIGTVAAESAEVAPFDMSDWEAIVRHDKVEVISYPYEWTFGMLRDAALLQLELLLEGLEEDLMVRDSTPYNVQWRGVQPVFIDTPSFGQLDPGCPWLGYRQFCQLFLNPLMLQAYLDVPFQPWLRGNLDGIDPEIFRKLFRFTDVFRPGVLAHVFLQSSLESSESRTSEALRQEMREAGMHKQLIKSVVSKLHKLVSGMRWKPARSRWSGYTEARGYADVDLTVKEAFVRQACQREPLGTCWDLGANDGRFSLIAAEAAQAVLALDSDSLVLERLYQRLKESKVRNVLPLYFNFADPSPGLGWRKSERRPLSARSRPDLILCLAVFHHLVITANIPLEDLLDYLHSFGCRLVVEFVTREDAMVKALLTSKDDPFLDYDLARFESWIQGRFSLVERRILPGGTRVLFELAPGE